MSGKQIVLEFKGVQLFGAARDQPLVRNASFMLRAGGAMILRVTDGNESPALCDAAQGLALPERGAIRFLGEDWGAMPPERAAKRRSRIGRVFDSRGWISNLDVIENVTLAQRHHTTRPLQEIVEEAERLARSFGLAGIPAGRPEWVPAGDLRRAEWVRAFLGSPPLLLLELPAAGVAREHAGKLVEAVIAARERGTAVLVTTAVEHEHIWKHERLADAERFEMRGPEMVFIGRESP